jgi:hypothetical protein
MLSWLKRDCLGSDLWVRWPNLCGLSPNEPLNLSLSLCLSSLPQDENEPLRLQFVNKLHSYFVDRVNALPAAFLSFFSLSALDPNTKIAKLSLEVGVCVCVSTCVCVSALHAAFLSFFSLSQHQDCQNVSRGVCLCVCVCV